MTRTKFPARCADRSRCCRGSCGRRGTRCKWLLFFLLPPCRGLQCWRRTGHRYVRRRPRGSLRIRCGFWDSMSRVFQSGIESFVTSEAVIIGRRRLREGQVRRDAVDEDRGGERPAATTLVPCRVIRHHIPLHCAHIVLVCPPVTNFCSI
jgi:hypothetical protein